MRSHNNRLPGGGYGYMPGTYSRSAQPSPREAVSDIIDVIQIGQDVLGGGGGSEQPPPPWGAGRDHYYNNPAVGCPEQPTVDRALDVVGRMSAGERTELSRLLRAANGGYGPSAGQLLDRWTAPWWIKAVFGGVDCRSTSASGQQLRAYWDAMFSRYPESAYPGTTTGGATGGTVTGGGTIPGTNIPLPDIDITWPPTEGRTPIYSPSPGGGGYYPTAGGAATPNTGLLLAAGIGLLLFATVK